MPAHTTPIKVFLLAQTSLNRVSVHEWLMFLGLTGEEAADALEPFHTVSDAETLVALCGKRCYASFIPGLNPNVTKIRDNPKEYLENILKSGHGSILEHATFTFAIEGCTRVFTPEMNRHRAGVAVSEGSLRYIRLTDVAWWLPTSLILTPEERAALLKLQQLADTGAQDAGRALALEAMNPAERELALAATRKTETERLFQQAFEQDGKTYLDLCDLWKIDQLSNFHQKKQLTSMFRRIVGMGMSTGGIWTLNIRALRHVIAMRTAEPAEEEIRYVFDQIADHVNAAIPLALCDFTRSATGVWAPGYPKV